MRPCPSKCLKAAGDESFSTLVKNGDNTYTLTDKHGIKENFGTTGLLTSRVDRSSNTITYSYTTGLLTQISDWYSRNTTLTYTSGHLTGVTDWASRSATLGYDGSNRLTSITRPDPDGGGALSAPVWSFSYNTTTNLLTQVTNPLSNATQYAYGNHNRLTTITNPGSTTWTLASLQTKGWPANSSGNALVAANPTAAFTNERSNTTTFKADRFGNLTELTT